MPDRPSGRKKKVPKPDRPSGRIGLVALLSHAVTDAEVRSRLFADPEAVAKEFDLNREELIALKGIEQTKIEEAAREMVNRAEWTIAIFIRVRF